MTIRLEDTEIMVAENLVGNGCTVFGYGTPIAFTDTEAEAERAKLAFEQVLLPRFTRDEAIALAKQEHALRGTIGGGLADERARKIYDAAYTDAIRNLMRALAAAGVFSDCGPPECVSREGCAQIMADKLDAAGISVSRP